MEKIILALALIILLILSSCTSESAQMSSIVARDNAEDQIVTPTTMQAQITTAPLSTFLTYQGTIQGISTAGNVQGISIDYPEGWSVLSEGKNYPLSFLCNPLMVLLNVPSPFQLR